MQFQVGYVVSTGVSLTSGTWTQVAGTDSPSVGVSMYVNGQVVSSAAGVNGFDFAAVDTINLNNNAITFGYEYGVTNGSTDSNTASLNFQGGIAAVSVWDRITAPCKILADYNANGPAHTTGRLAEVFGKLFPKHRRRSRNAASFISLSMGLIVLGVGRIRRSRR